MSRIQDRIDAFMKASAALDSKMAEYKAGIQPIKIDDKTVLDYVGKALLAAAGVVTGKAYVVILTILGKAFSSKEIKEEKK